LVIIETWKKEKLFSGKENLQVRKPGDSSQKSSTSTGPQSKD
jgi:hypothetical protein